MKACNFPEIPRKMATSPTASTKPVASSHAEEVGRSGDFRSTRCHGGRYLRRCGMGRGKDWVSNNLRSTFTHKIHGTGIFAYYKNQPKSNVSKYTIHGSYGLVSTADDLVRMDNSWSGWPVPRCEIIFNLYHLIDELLKKQPLIIHGTGIFACIYQIRISQM